MTAIRPHSWSPSFNDNLSTEPKDLHNETLEQGRIGSITSEFTIAADAAPMMEGEIETVSFVAPELTMTSDASDSEVPCEMTREVSSISPLLESSNSTTTASKPTRLERCQLAIESAFFANSSGGHSQNPDGT
jgi:hypothetical protein